MSAEIDEYPSLHFQDIRKKQSVADTHTDGRTDNVKTVVCGRKVFFVVFVCVCVGGGGGEYNYQPLGAVDDLMKASGDSSSGGLQHLGT